jgi:hypothetical protein
MPYMCFSGSLHILFGLDLGSVLYHRGLYSGYSTPVLRMWIRCVPIVYSNSMYTDDKGAMCSTGVSLVSLWRPSCSLVVLIMYLVCIFLSKPLDSGNHESWYKAFRLFYYLIYGCCIVCLVPLFYPKA